MELSLRKYFKLAESWDAIVLIDEADTYTAKRTKSDREGSNLVAGKFTSTLLCSQIYRSFHFSLPPHHRLLPGVSRYAQ